MEGINDIITLSNILEVFTKRSSVTNNYLLLDAYEEFIREGRLFYINKKSNVCILVEHEAYFQLYYYINNQDELINLNNNKPVVMEIIYRDELHRPDNIFNFWEKCEFQKHITRENMQTSYKQITMPHDTIIENPHIDIRYAESESEAIFAQELIERTFDKYTGEILKYKEILNFVKRKRILCGYYNEEPCGLLQFNIKNNVVVIGHLVVAPEFSGLGIASKLVKAYIIDNAVHDNTRYQLWVIQNNKKAKTLYKRFGFMYGNKTSCSMLKK